MSCTKVRESGDRKVHQNPFCGVSIKTKVLLIILLGRPLACYSGQCSPLLGSPSKEVVLDLWVQPPSATDIRGGTALCWGPSCVLQGLSGIPDLHPLDASSILPPPLGHDNNQKCLLRERESPLAKNHCSEDCHLH